jgi:uncharacterized protein
MKFSEELGSNLNRITAYDQDAIEINEQRHFESIILTPDTAVVAWGIQDASGINESSLRPILECEPEIVLLGTGQKIQFPDPRLLMMFTQEGIGVEVLDSTAACRTFNLILAEGRRVVAGMLLPGSI